MFRCKCRFAGVAVHKPKRRMCHGELRIDFDGACKKGYRVGLIRVDQLPALAVRLQAFQRWRRSLGQRCVVFPHTREGLTNTSPELPCDLIERVQHLFFAGCLDLLFVNDIARSAIACAHCQYVLASNACDRDIQNRGASGPYANFTGDFCLETGIHRLAHQLESLPDPLIGDKTQIGDCSSCTAMPCRNVPSKTGSPVELAKSASTTLSFSVRNDE